jgi:hypothetical protein
MAPFHVSSDRCLLDRLQRAALFENLFLVKDLLLVIFKQQPSIPNLLQLTVIIAHHSLKTSPCGSVFSSIGNAVSVATDGPHDELE